LTALQAEGCGGGFAADYKKGARLAPQVVAAYRRRVVQKGCVRGKVLKFDRPTAVGFLGLTAACGR